MSKFLQIKLGQDTDFDGVLRVKGEVIVVPDGYDLDDGDVVLARIDTAEVERKDKAAKQAARTARAIRPAKIVIFTTNANPVGNNQPAMLSWQTKRSDSVMLEGAAVEINGSATVTTKKAKRYNLLAVNQFGKDRAHIDLAVSPEILTFTASAISVPANTDVTFTWTTTLADSLTFESNAVALNGQIVVNVKRTKTFNLVATSVLGTDTAKIDITVI